LTRVIAHRGASGHRPENTLSAYALAVEMRADMIEIDLHRTQDGAVVVAHNSALSSLGGSGEIADANLESVRSLDAGEGERVPLLSEVLDAFAQSLPFNLELKVSSRGVYAGLEALALAACEAHGILDQTLFSSFFDPVLEELRRCSQRVRLGVLVSPRAPRAWLARAQSVGAIAVNLHTRTASRSNVERAHGEGLEVNVYTVDDRETFVRLLDAGVDGIFTNYPDRLRALLETRNQGL
jgi:glycerophosphoryl diester phosphodiesterase